MLPCVAMETDGMKTVIAMTMHNSDIQKCFLLCNMLHYLPFFDFTSLLYPKSDHFREKHLGENRVT